MMGFPTEFAVLHTIKLTMIRKVIIIHWQRSVFPVPESCNKRKYLPEVYKQTHEVCRHFLVFFAH